MARMLRTIGLALLCALLIGFAIGTWLRCRLEQPVRYLGSAGSACVSDSRACASTPLFPDNRRAEAIRTRG